MITALFVCRLSHWHQFPNLIFNFNLSPTLLILSLKALLFLFSRYKKFFYDLKINQTSVCAYTFCSKQKTFGKKICQKQCPVHNFYLISKKYNDKDIIILLIVSIIDLTIIFSFFLYYNEFCFGELLGNQSILTC